MTGQDDRNLKMVRLMYYGDESERARIAPDIVWHVPGHNPVSGIDPGVRRIHSPDAVSAWPRSHAWDFELEDVMINGDLVVTRFSLKG